MHLIVYCFFLILDDALVQNGTLLFTDEATIQCITVLVISTADDSCLSLSLSSPTTVSGLTLSPALATICVVQTEGELLYYPCKKANMTFHNV